MTLPQAELDALRERHGIPGAVVGLLHNGERTLVASGVANLATGVEMTTDTVFLLGSITKTWMGTLTLGMVDAGLLELDAPVRHYLPGFRPEDPHAPRITIRHLLTHASGVDAGDFARECGRNPDAVRRYVAELDHLGRLFAPGELSSYDNAGFMVLGRIMEVVTGANWDDLITDRLFSPLGLSHTGLCEAHAVRFRAAVGHFPSAEEGGAPEPTSVWMLPYSMGPAGATLVTSVEDVLTFAQLHIDGGVTRTGQRLLTETSVKDMQQRHFDLARDIGMALTWVHAERGGSTVISHGGGSHGGHTQLTVVPEAGCAIIAYANHANSSDFLLELTNALLAQTVPDALPPTGGAGVEASSVELGTYVGTYERWGTRGTVTVEGDGLALTIESTDPEHAWSVYATGSHPTQQGTVITPELVMFSDGKATTPAFFRAPDDEGRPQWLYMGGRLARRVGSAPE